MSHLPAFVDRSVESPLALQFSSADFKFKLYCVVGRTRNRSKIRSRNLSSRSTCREYSTVEGREGPEVFSVD